MQGAEVVSNKAAKVRPKSTAAAHTRTHRPGSWRWFVSGVFGGVSRVDVCRRARLIGRLWRGDKQVTTEL
jgi:hypothetical protein